MVYLAICYLEYGSSVSTFKTTFEETRVSIISQTAHNAIGAYYCTVIISGGSRLGPGGHRPPQILPRPPPQIFRVITVHKLLNKGRRLYVFKVFIEYRLNLGSDCIIMFSVNLTFGETLVMRFCYLFFSAKIAILGL